MQYTGPLCHNLFDWADTRERDASQPAFANHIQHKYRVSPLRARLLAELQLGGRV